MSSTRPPKSLLAEFGLLYATAIWGATFFIVKDSLASVDAVVMVGYRFLLAAAVLAVGLKIARKPLFLYWKPSLILGIILWSLYISQTIGLKYTTASNSGFITGLFVAFVPVFTYLLNRKALFLPLLPECEPEQALQTLAELDRSKQILARDIVTVDLRLPDRVTVRLSDAAAAARDEALKAAAEKTKKKGKGGEA